MLHFEKKYSLPDYVVKKRLKKLIALNYKYKTAKFDNSLDFKRIFFSLIRSILIFIKLAFCTIRDSKTSKYKLILDDVRDDTQLKRFEKLINLVGKEKTLVIVNGTINLNKFDSYNINVIDYKKYNNSTNIITNVIKNELLGGIWICLKSSILLKINLFPIYISLIKSYYHYKCIFDFNKAEYMIQERHYSTNPIKNYLFKNSGGKATTSMQKNLVENDFMAYYIDIDYLFTLGEETIDITYNYGARIEKIFPVGSFFMEY